MKIFLIKIYNKIVLNLASLLINISKDYTNCNYIVKYDVRYYLKNYKGKVSK